MCKDHSNTMIERCHNIKGCCQMTVMSWRVQVSQFILPPGQLAPRGTSQPWLACPSGANCPGKSCPPPWLSSPPWGKLSRPVYLAHHPTKVKIYTCYFVIFLYFSLSHCSIFLVAGVGASCPGQFILTPTHLSIKVKLFY